MADGVISGVRSKPSRKPKKRLSNQLPAIGPVIVTTGGTLWIRPPEVMSNRNVTVDFWFSCGILLIVGDASAI